MMSTEVAVVPVAVAAKPKRKRPSKSERRKKAAAKGSGKAKPQKRKAPRKTIAVTGPVVGGKGAYYLTGSAAWNLPGFSGTLGGGVSGHGAYKARKNSLLGMIDNTGGVPSVRNSTRGEACVVSHREFLIDVKTPFFEDGDTFTPFTLKEHSVNPANPEVFPWLAQLASNYQEWECRGMLVEYKTLCTDYTTEFTLGSVMLSAEYNVLAAPPVGKTELMNMENSGSVKPSCSLIMPIECARAQTPVSHLYVGPLDADVGDLRLYDLCKFYFGTSGIPKENVKIGELWVTYEIAFYKPKIIAFPASQGGMSFMLEGQYTQDHPLENGFVIGKGNSPHFKYDQVNKWVDFPPIWGQTYLVFYFIYHTAEGPTYSGAIPGLLGSGLEIIDFSPFNTQPAAPVEFEAPNYAGGAATPPYSSKLYLLRSVETPGVSFPTLFWGTDGDVGDTPHTQYLLMITLWNKDWVGVASLEEATREFVTISNSRKCGLGVQGVNTASVVSSLEKMRAPSLRRPNSGTL